MVPTNLVAKNALNSDTKKTPALWFWKRIIITTKMGKLQEVRDLARLTIVAREIRLEMLKSGHPVSWFSDGLRFFWWFYLCLIMAELYHLNIRGLKIFNSDKINKVCYILEKVSQVLFLNIQETHLRDNSEIPRKFRSLHSSISPNILSHVDTDKGRAFNVC